jgi:hypothetical protein
MLLANTVLLHKLHKRCTCASEQSVMLRKPVHSKHRDMVFSQTLIPQWNQCSEQSKQPSILCNIPGDHAARAASVGAHSITQFPSTRSQEMERPTYSGDVKEYIKAMVAYLGLKRSLVTMIVLWNEKAVAEFAKSLSASQRPDCGRIQNSRMPS